MLSIHDKEAMMSEEILCGRQGAQSIELTMRLNYLLFLPQSYGNEPSKKWPLILFLHGAGERGDDLELVKIHGIAKIVAKQPDFPFVCVSPQCPEGTLWTDHHLVLKALLDGVLSTYTIALDRVYLTGLSLGGYGTWSLAMAYPQTFAAIAPICGGGMPQWIGGLKDVPVWAFHGADDPVVPVEQSQSMVDALRASGGNARLTIYPGVGHDSWTQTYDNPELYEWFLQHRRQSPGP
jgi:predicted peptidase